MSNFDVIQFVSSQVDLFNGSVSDESVSWQQESQFAIQAFQKNDFLAKTAMGNPQSAQNAIINVAAIGITLNPAAKLAYLVPRDRGVHLDISYMGLLHIAQSTGSILWGQCKLVYSNDTYESNGLDVAPTHKYSPFGNRGDVVGGYCTVKTCDGDYLTDEMSLADIKKVQATSKASNGPWKTFWEEMARKTIVKRASKYWPKVDRLDKAINYLNTDAGEGLRDNSEVNAESIIDVESHIISIAQKQGRTEVELFQWLSKSYKREIQCFDDVTEDEKQFIARKLEGKA